MAYQGEDLAHIDANFVFNAAITTPILDGEIRFNNASQQLATVMWISKTTADGYDISTSLLDLLEAGSLMLFRSTGSTQKFQEFRVESITDAGTWVEFSTRTAEAQCS